MSDACYISSDAGAPIGTVITIDGSEGHHAAVVKRTRLGESVLIVDGKGTARRGIVRAVSKSGIDVELEADVSPAPSPWRWTIVQALPKGERAQIALEAVTELGATSICAWQASRSISRWDKKAEKGLVKWRNTAVSSMKQSRRCILPQVDYVTTADVCQLIAEADLGVIAHEDATTDICQISVPPRGHIVIVVGPEGGITDEELDAFRAAGGIAVVVSDGVLRTSSAAAITLAQTQLLARIGSDELR